MTSSAARRVSTLPGSGVRDTFSGTPRDHPMSRRSAADQPAGCQTASTATRRVSALPGVRCTRHLLRNTERLRDEPSVRRRSGISTGSSDNVPTRASLARRDRILNESGIRLPKSCRAFPDRRIENILGLNVNDVLPGSPAYSYYIRDLIRHNDFGDNSFRHGYSRTGGWGRMPRFP